MYTRIGIVYTHKTNNVYIYTHIHTYMYSVYMYSTYSPPCSKLRPLPRLRLISIIISMIIHSSSFVIAGIMLVAITGMSTVITVITGYWY